MKTHVKLCLHQRNNGSLKRTVLLDTGTPIVDKGVLEKDCENTERGLFDVISLLSFILLGTCHDLSVDGID